MKWKIYCVIYQENKMTPPFSGSSSGRANAKVVHTQICNLFIDEVRVSAREAYSVNAYEPF